MAELSPGGGGHVDAPKPELRRRIEERAYALWESEGRFERRALDYWLQAEQEVLSQSTAGEEDDQERPDRGRTRRATS